MNDSYEGIDTVSQFSRGKERLFDTELSGCADGILGRNGFHVQAGEVITRPY